MRFFFNERKAAQAAAYLVKLHGGTITLLALIKLLYLADRESLLEIGQPITGDRMVSMPHGPVLSGILDLINMGDLGEGRPWYVYLSERSNNTISLAAPDPDLSELSRYELEVLERIHQRFGSMAPFDLRDLTHDLPEWQDPLGSSLPIDPADILRSAGKPDSEIQRVSGEAEEVYFLNNLGRVRA